MTLFVVSIIIWGWPALSNLKVKPKDSCSFVGVLSGCYSSCLVLPIELLAVDRPGKNIHCWRETGLAASTGLPKKKKHRNYTRGLCCKLYQGVMDDDNSDSSVAIGAVLLVAAILGCFIAALLLAKDFFRGKLPSTVLVGALTLVDFIGAFSSSVFVFHGFVRGDNWLGGFPQCEFQVRPHFLIIGIISLLRLVYTFDASTSISTSAR